MRRTDHEWNVCSDAPNQAQSTSRAFLIPDMTLRPRTTWWASHRRCEPIGVVFSPIYLGILTVEGGATKKRAGSAD